jgi:hypothetical protein
MEQHMNIKNYKFLGVLGVPWIGINHLSNLISTSQYIAPKTDVDDYQSYINDLYESNDNNIHHIYKDDNYDPRLSMMYPIDYTRAEQLIKNNTLTTVLPGHTEDAYWVMHNVKYLGKQAIVTIENYNISMKMPESRRKQIEKDHPWQHKFLYDKDVVCRLFDLSDEDVLAIDVADFHSDDISPIIHALNNTFGLELDFEFCQRLHTHWMNKVFGTE